MKEFGETLDLTDWWARDLLDSMEWNKRKERTRKIEQSLQLLSEETFKFQRAISTAVFKHDIPTSLIVNLDQTPLRYFSPGKYTFSFRGAKNVRIKGVEDKRQITRNFAVTLYEKTCWFNYFTRENLEAACKNLIFWTLSPLVLQKTTDQTPINQ